ncbi:MAG: hypothetical protein ACREAN_00965 [Nitrosopumilaceae archaeon]
MRRSISVLILVVIMVAVLVGSLAYSFIRTQSVNSIIPCPDSFNEGHYSLYAGGSSTNCLFTIPRGGNLTGSFRANASLDFFVQTRNEFEQNSPGSIPTSFMYGLKNVGSSTLNVPLTTGSYYIDFFFTYRYQIVSPINGTGYAGSTSLNITNTFVVKPAS